MRYPKVVRYHTYHKTVQYRICNILGPRNIKLLLYKLLCENYINFYCCGVNVGCKNCFMTNILFYFSYDLIATPILFENLLIYNVGPFRWFHIIQMRQHPCLDKCPWEGFFLFLFNYEKNPCFGEERKSKRIFQILAAHQKYSLSLISPSLPSPIKFCDSSWVFFKPEIQWLLILKILRDDSMFPGKMKKSSK